METARAGLPQKVIVNPIIYQSSSEPASRKKQGERF